MHAITISFGSRLGTPFGWRRSLISSGDSVGRSHSVPAITSILVHPNRDGSRRSQRRGLLMLHPSSPGEHHRTQTDSIYWPSVAVWGGMILFVLVVAALVGWFIAARLGG
jgi:hypothetical protein